MPSTQGSARKWIATRSYLFLSARAVRFDQEAGTLAETELAAFAGDRWVVTVSPDDAFSADAALERWERQRSRGLDGPKFLIYCLLDVLIAEYFNAIEVFDDYYDAVSEGIFADRPLAPAQQRHWFEIRQALVRFHRLIGPARELVSTLMRREHELSAELYPYYQDRWSFSRRTALEYG